MSVKWDVINPGGKNRVIVTRQLPGTRWLKALALADARVEMCTEIGPLPGPEIIEVMAGDCQAVLGQYGESWNRELFEALKAAGGRAYSNFAVGYNNIDLDAATDCGIPVGNTPGVLTDATAEMCAALAFAAARRIAEADTFMRTESMGGWLPNIFMGELFHGRTLGVVGLGRIGLAFAKLMASACHMDVIYHGRSRKPEAEAYFRDLGEFFRQRGERPVACAKARDLDDLCRRADVISINTLLDGGTRHLIGAGQLALMKENAILINAARGPVMDETALVAHLKAHPGFRAGLDVYEDEPNMAPGLAEMKNAVLAPHMGSATGYTRQGMATLAACNISAVLRGLPAWNREDITAFLSGDFPAFAPSIINASLLGYRTAD